MAKFGGLALIGPFTAEGAERRTRPAALLVSALDSAENANSSFAFEFAGSTSNERNSNDIHPPRFVSRSARLVIGP